MASLYINSLLTVCRYSGLVTQIPARFGSLVRSKIAGLKGQICAVGGNNAVVILSLVWGQLAQFGSENKYPMAADERAITLCT
jgi:hypothetical protein